MSAALPTGRRGQALALALTLTALATIWIGAISPMIAWFEDRAATLDIRRVLASHMADLSATLPDLRARLADMEAHGPPPVAVLDGATDAIAGASLQEKLQEIARRVGAKLNSIETLAAEQRGAYRRIGVRVSLTAQWPVLIGLFGAVEKATPRMLVDDVQLRASPLRLRPDEAQISATFTLFAFRSEAASAASPAVPAARNAQP